MSRSVRVLVVDDSTIFRKVVRDALAKIPQVEVVGHAADGEMALCRMAELRPDVVTLDLEMPKLGGLDVLRQMRARNIDAAAIMVSSLSGQGARATTEALRLGAFDFVLKPAGQNVDENARALQAELAPRIRACCQDRLAADGGPQGRDSGTLCDSASLPAGRRAARTLCRVPEVVVIGTSTGGPAALAKVLPQLPRDFPVPILIVQHMPPMFTKTMADDLNRQCELEIREANGGEPVKPGYGYIAPGGRQLKVVRTSAGVFTRVTDDPPEHSCRPSVDYLFRSVSKEYDHKVLAVIMTGMGDDGSRALSEMHPQGVPVIAQDEASCTVFGMPRCVVENGHADVICPLSEIPAQMQRMVQRSRTLACQS